MRKINEENVYASILHHQRWETKWMQILPNLGQEYVPAIYQITKNSSAELVMSFSYDNHTVTVLKSCEIKTKFITA